MARFNSVSFPLRNKKVILVRAMTVQDANVYYEFIDQIALDSTNTLQYIGRKRKTYNELDAQFTSDSLDNSTLNVGAFDQVKLVGQLRLRMPHSDHPWFQHLAQFGLMIIKDYWGQGIGKELLAIQESFARSIGITRIEATVRSENERGINLYKRAGYKIEGTRMQAARIDGKYLDEYYIAKLLDCPNHLLDINT